MNLFVYDNLLQVDPVKSRLHIRFIIVFFIRINRDVCTLFIF